MMRAGKTETKQPKTSSGKSGKSHGRQWTYGLCSCCDDCGEFLSFVGCPCVYFPILSLRAREMPAAFMCGGPHVLRTKIREERKIEGSICGDCCVTYFCPCCSIIQMSKEARDTEPLL